MGASFVDTIMLLCYYAFMGTRITADLEDANLIKLLKLEAQNTNSSMKGVLIKALESYFHNLLETRTVSKMSEEVFKEWEDKRDTDYDML